MPTKKVDENPTATQLFLFFYLIVFLMCSFLGLFVLFFATLKAEIYFFIGVTVLSTALFCLMVFLVKLLVDRIYLKLKTDDLKKLRINMITGYSLMILLATPPRILVFFLETNIFTYCYSYVVFPITSFLIHYYFNLESNEIYDFDVEKHGGLLSLIFVFSFLTFAPSRISTWFSDPAFINLNQIFLGFFTIPPMVELVLVLSGAIKLNEEEKKKTEEEMLKPKEQKHVALEMMAMVGTDPRLECKICLLQYSETSRIPRILESCGHTLCEECANSLLMKNNRIHLLCPHCQTPTVVKGNANLLAKNFLVLDYMKNVKSN